MLLRASGMSTVLAVGLGRTGRRLCSVPTRIAAESRSDLRKSKRVVVKLGSAVLTNSNGQGLAVGRIGSIVEQVAALQKEGKEMAVITSGAVALGKMRFKGTLAATNQEPVSKMACAAAGQSGLTGLYETLFAQCGFGVAQVLVTKSDFKTPSIRASLRSTIDEIIRMKYIPIINTNDAVSPPNQGDDDLIGCINLQDNDSLAALLASDLRADLLMLLSDVDGIYSGPPGEPDSLLLSRFCPADLSRVRFGSKSSTGTGGMESKVDSAIWALEQGCSVLIANGVRSHDGLLKSIVDGKRIGTFFTLADQTEISAEQVALTARKDGRKLQTLTAKERGSIVDRIASLLLERESEILLANRLDMELAQASGLPASVLGRLALSPSKLRSLASGLRKIATESTGLIGNTVRATRISTGLTLQQVTMPIGVLLVIFESRPDALPQVASLAIASGNGLVLKGGKEANHSNACLLALVKEALASFGCAGTVGMVGSRDEVGDLLKLGHLIDLVIPRGSKALVASIQEQSKQIPVLGHADGICHVYVDQDADHDKACRIVIDSKCDYPAACNAMETLLIHRGALATGLFDKLVSRLRENKVELRLGPQAAAYVSAAPSDRVVRSFRTEYGGLECAIELVDSLEEAVRHILEYGSCHTECIVTENEAAAQQFFRDVDSACVFHNSSTRFADGYRFGLGAEVGISTGRIHARGPVGVEGLLTTKWLLEGDGHTVADFADGGRCRYVHQPLTMPAASSLQSGSGASK